MLPLLYVAFLEVIAVGSTNSPIGGKARWLWEDGDREQDLLMGGDKRTVLALLTT